MAAEQQARRARRVRIFWIAATAIAVAAVAIALIPRAAEADFAVIDRGTVRVDLVDEGRTRMHDVYVVSAPVSGRVERVEVEPGDAVAAGVVVARMTPAGTGFLDLRNDQQARAGHRRRRSAACAPRAPNWTLRNANTNARRASPNRSWWPPQRSTRARPGWMRPVPRRMPRAPSSRRPAARCCPPHVPGAVWCRCARQWEARCCACRRRARPCSRWARRWSRLAIPR